LANFILFFIHFPNMGRWSICGWQLGAQGLARAFVGHGSDGLVKIANASLCGIKGGQITRPAATAYAYRSHSGAFGMAVSRVKRNSGITV
jgi:hypothetical protein